MIRRWNSLLHKKKGKRTNLPDYLPNPLTRCMISSSSVIFHLQSLIFQHSGSSTNLHIKDSVTAQLRHSSSYWTITSYLWSLIPPLPNPLNKALCCLLLCANRRPDLNMLHNAEPSSTQNPDPFAKLVQAIQQFLQPPSTTASQSASTSPMARPTMYSGEECSGFLLQCSLFFEMQLQVFPSDWAKIAYIIPLLSGRALQWAQSIWDANNPITNSLTLFITHFKEVFGQTASELSVNDQLFWLRQGSSTMSDLCIAVPHSYGQCLEWNGAPYHIQTRAQCITSTSKRLSMMMSWG